MSMAEEALAVGGSEGAEALHESALQVIQGAGGGLTEMGFEFSKGHFDGIEIWAVRRQVAHAGPAGGDQFRDTGDFMGGEIVEDDDVTGVQFGTEDRLEISGEDLGVDRPLNQKGGRETLDPQGGDEGGGLPVPMRHVRNATLALGTAAVEPGHLGVQARFVDEDQAGAVPTGLRLAPNDPGGLDVRPFLLGGVRRFFYSLIPSDQAGATGR